MIYKDNSIQGNTFPKKVTQELLTQEVRKEAIYNAVKTLIDFIGNVDMPEYFLTDGDEEFTGKSKEFVK